MGLFDPIDWNGDGEHDFVDEMLEFAIFRECTKDDYDSDEDDYDEEDCDVFRTL